MAPRPDFRSTARSWRQGGLHCRPQRAAWVAPWPAGSAAPCPAPLSRTSWTPAGERTGPTDSGAATGTLNYNGVNHSSIVNGQLYEFNSLITVHHYHIKSIITNITLSKNTIVFIKERAGMTWNMFGSPYGTALTCLTKFKSMRPVVSEIKTTGVHLRTCRGTWH